VLTTSSISENTNYKVYGSSSPVDASSDSLIPSPESIPNYQILAASSPPGPAASSSPFSPDSLDNYIIHESSSPLALATTRQQARPKFSQESLVVPPLNTTKKKKSVDGFGYYKQRSRENLRARAESLKSIKSIKSISSFITQESARALFVAPALVSVHGVQSQRSPTGGGPSSVTEEQAQNPWAGQQAAGPSQQQPLSPITQQRMQMTQPYPHQWSSQLSTVMSESEAGSSRSLSRSVSLASSGNGGGVHGRRSSTGWAAGSSHSRQMHSISSSLGARLEEADESSAGGSTSRSDSIDRPQATYHRTPTAISRTVRHQDEHGDGLADLYDPSPMRSRSGLSGFFSGSNTESSSRNLHSSSSTRSNSFTSASIPAWAR
jgi:hypothetical protein